MHLIDWKLISTEMRHESPETMLREMYQELGSCQKVADRIGVNKSTVVQRLRSFGIKVKPRGGANNPNGRRMMKPVDMEDYDDE